MIEEWPFPPLAGIIGCPTLRPDGSLFDRPGYDEATGLVLENTVRMPPIPAKPTKDQAVAALEILEELLTGFPFSSDHVNGQIVEASRAVALSQLMTPIVRGAMAAAPMHLTTAPEAGSGKSYLADLAAMIAISERCPVLALAPREEESEKRLIGAALAGMPIISIDNANRTLGGDFLAQVTERPRAVFAPAGRVEPLRIDNSFLRASPTATAPPSTAIRCRTATCRLDANREDPEPRVRYQSLAMIRQGSRQIHRRRPDTSRAPGSKQGTASLESPATRDGRTASARRSSGSTAPIPPQQSPNPATPIRYAPIAAPSSTHGKPCSATVKAMSSPRSSIRPNPIRHCTMPFAPSPKTATTTVKSPVSESACGYAKTKTPSSIDTSSQSIAATRIAPDGSSRPSDPDAGVAGDAGVVRAQVRARTHAQVRVKCCATLPQLPQLPQS
jgi:hypothetical protein